MLLDSSHPHDDFCINGLRGRIKLRPMDLPCHRVVVTEADVDAWVAVRFGWVLRVVGHIGRRLPLMGQSVHLSWDKDWPPCAADCEKKQDD